MPGPEVDSGAADETARMLQERLHGFAAADRAGREAGIAGLVDFVFEVADLHVLQEAASPLASLLAPGTIVLMCEELFVRRWKCLSR